MSRDWIHPDEQDEYLVDYLFDLNGYLIIKGAIASEDLAEMNQWVDEHWDYVDAKRRSTIEESGVPSEELLSNLTEEQRKIIQPMPPRFAPGRSFAQTAYTAQQSG